MRRLGIAIALALAALFAGCDSEEQEAARAQAEAEADRLEHRFRRARSIEPPTPNQQRMIAELEAIGYASGSQAPRSSGITRHDRSASQAGLNFFASGHTEGAVLMDMNGAPVHAWHLPLEEAFGGVPRTGSEPARRWWRRAFLFPNGDVVAIVTNSGVFRIDAASRLLWATQIQAHHDLAIDADGTLYVLTRKIHVRPEIHPERPIAEDRVAILAPGGELTRTISILDALLDSDYASLWTAAEKRSGDIFHTNSIELLDGSIADVHPAFREGNLLISMLRLDAIAVLDPDSERIVWAHTGDYRAQHDPKVLPNGRLLLFDNHGDGPSAVLEFAPESMEVVWEFRGSEAEPFYSETCGTAQRLANGNTLVTESDFGRAFEVTPDRRVVWEFYNPHRAGETGEFIATLPELIRLPRDFPSDWIDPATVEPAAP